MAQPTIRPIPPPAVVGWGEARTPTYRGIGSKPWGSSPQSTRRMECMSRIFTAGRASEWTCPPSCGHQRGSERASGQGIGEPCQPKSC